MILPRRPFQPVLQNSLRVELYLEQRGWKPPYDALAPLVHSGIVAGSPRVRQSCFGFWRRGLQYYPYSIGSSGHA